MRNGRGLAIRAAVLGSVVLVGILQGCGGAVTGNPRSDAGTVTGTGATPAGGSGSGGNDVSTGTSTGAGSSVGSSSGSSVSFGGTTPPSSSSASSIGPVVCPAPIFDAATLPLPPPPLCAPVVPTSTAISVLNAGSVIAFAPFGSSAPVAGGFYEFPSCTPVGPEPTDALALDSSNDEVRVSGIVTTFAGFGVYWSAPTPPDAGDDALAYSFAPLDVSSFAGIQFDIAGDAGPLGLVTFTSASTNQESPSESCGTCTGSEGTCNELSSAPVVGITSVSTTVQVLWSDLTTSGPAFDPARVGSLFWQFTWTVGQEPYSVDVAISNVQFIPQTGSGASTP